jgi:hypothetical protein
MKIGLHDADKTNFPNLALMKISAWHKQSGDSVEWWNPLEQYDTVYSSKVFTFTEEDPYLPENTIKGGTGYGAYDNLPEEIDRMFPDYSLYPDVNYAIGYLTRGCIRKCPWCIVPKKEGYIKPYRYWTEVARPNKRDIVFMDNNVLASDFGLEQMASMIGQSVRVDFNQGLDARLITPEVAEIISRLKWCNLIRMAADTDTMLDTVIEKIKLLEKYGVKSWRIFVYVLTTDIESAERRCITLRDIGANPFAQPYRDFTNNIGPTEEQKQFARWVNRKWIFKRVKTFAEYKRRRTQ